MTKHHLVPKSQGGGPTADLCQMCHKQIHALYDNKTLGEVFNTIEKLREELPVQKYIKWAVKQNRVMKARVIKERQGGRAKYGR